MKKTTLLFCLTAVVLAGCLLLAYYKIKSHNEFFAAVLAERAIKIAAQESQPQDTSDIVFFGDSITEWMSFAALGPTTKNRGIGYDKTEDALKRIGHIMRGKPKKLFIMIGANDIPHTAVAKTVQNLKALLDSTKLSPATQVFVESILPSYRDAEKTKALNQLYEAECSTRGITFIDEYFLFLKGNTINPIYSTDQLHLNKTGSELRLSALKKYL